MLFGPETFERINAGKITVAGLGAVGSYAVEALARGGVGSLRLIDCDVISKTNINRQIFALESTIGLAKTEAASARIRDINPGCRVEGIREFIHAGTLDILWKNNPDAIIDAVDSLNPKIELIAGAYARGIPVFSSMGAAKRFDASLIRTGDLMDSSGCPFARRIRQRLRSRGVGEGIFCVYSCETAQPDHLPEGDVETEGFARGRRREPMGSMPTIPAIFGLLLAHYVLLRLARPGQELGRRSSP